MVLTYPQNIVVHSLWIDSSRDMASLFSFQGGISFFLFFISFSICVASPFTLEQLEQRIEQLEKNNVNLVY